MQPRRSAWLRVASSKEVLRKNAEEWLAPASPDEVQIAAELEKLPAFKVPRVPDAQLVSLGMKPQQCHVNCHAYVRLDPEKKSKMVTGWWLFGPGMFVLHSVVARDGRMFCITQYDGPGEFIFIVVPEIEAVDHGDHYKHVRKGKELGRFIRANPAEVIERGKQFIRQLEL